MHATQYSICYLSGNIRGKQTKQYTRITKSGNAPLFSSRDLKAFEGLVRPSTNFSKGARALEDPYDWAGAEADPRQDPKYLEAKRDLVGLSRDLVGLPGDLVKAYKIPGKAYKIPGKAYEIPRKAYKIPGKAYKIHGKAYKIS